VLIEKSFSGKERCLERLCVIAWKSQVILLGMWCAKHARPQLKHEKHSEWEKHFWGRGLQALVDTCLEIGAKCGKIETKDTSPRRIKITRTIQDKAEVVQKHVVQDVKDAIASNGTVAFTMDMWTDIKCHHFVSITTHYVKKASYFSLFEVCRSLTEKLLVKIFAGALKSFVLLMNFLVIKLVLLRYWQW